MASERETKPTIYTATAVLKTMEWREEEKRVFNEDTKSPKREIMFRGEKKRKNNNIETVRIVVSGKGR